MTGGYSQYAASLAENDDDSDMDYQPAATSHTEDGSTDAEILEEFEEEDDEDEEDTDVYEGQLRPLDDFRVEDR